MSQNHQKPEVACTLGKDRSEEREDEIRRELLPHYVQAEELDRGYTIIFEEVDETFEPAAKFIANELQCCSFAEYRLAVDPPYQQTRLTITGPEGTKELFQDGLIDRFEVESS